MKKLILLILCIAGIFSPAIAQWIIKPEYTAMSAYGDGMLKVQQYHNKFGIIDYSGKQVVPIKADSITDMSEGFGLVLVAEDGAYRIDGFVKNDKTFIPLSGKYYAGEYAFFSEYKLPVMNEKGVYGYIDPLGNQVISFSYINIHPFSEGYAAVSKTSKFNKFLSSSLKLVNVQRREKMIYIDSHEVPLSLQSELKKDAIYGATSFYKGEAMVTKKDKSCYIINTSGSIVRTDNSPSVSFNKKYCIVDTDADTEENFDDVSEEKLKKSGFRISKDNDLYGLVSSGKSSNNNQQKNNVKTANNDVSIKFSSLRARANNKNVANVQVILINSDDKDIDVFVRVTGASTKTSNVTIPANNRYRFSVAFSDVTKFEKRNLLVEIQMNDNIVRRNVKIDLEPNFDDL